MKTLNISIVLVLGLIGVVFSSGCYKSKSTKGSDDESPATDSELGVPAETQSSWIDSNDDDRFTDHVSDDTLSDLVVVRESETGVIESPKTDTDLGSDTGNNVVEDTETTLSTDEEIESDTASSPEMCMDESTEGCDRRADCRSLWGRHFDKDAACIRGEARIGCRSTDMPCSADAPYAIDPVGQCWHFDDGCIPAMFEPIENTDSRVLTLCQEGADAGPDLCDDPAYPPCEEDDFQSVFGCLDCDTGMAGVYQALENVIARYNTCKQDEDCIEVFPSTSCISMCSRGIPAAFKDEISSETSLISELFCEAGYKSECGFLMKSCAPVTVSCENNKCTQTVAF